MADHLTAGEIRAAGAVLWRPAGRSAQVAIVHRPKYDDWSFAKGKVDAGEHVLLTATREVREETGLQVTLGRCLPPVTYLVDGQPKRVDYWAARPSSGRFAPNSEVDQLDWVAQGRVAARLSYAHDVQLLADFIAGPRLTVPLVLVRHASAGRKSDWRKNDVLRPLDARGEQQASMLARLIGCFGRGRVISSPAERCLATVRPFAAFAGEDIEIDPALGVPDANLTKAARAAEADGMAKAAADAAQSAATDYRPVVICAHRENIPRMLSAVCDLLGAPVPAGRSLRKGEFWVLHRAAGRLAGAERHGPDPAGRAGSN
jgi:8-oxo-dGTP pyrophosphatase MutT (NUDIX family)